jgi:exodeoxyribonuclease VIII
MLDIMCDLETMSRGPDSALVGIGLVEFDFGQGLVGREFFRAVNLADACKHGGKMDPATVAWWLSQPKEAQNAIMFSTYPLRDALELVTQFVASCGKRDEVRMWAKGPSFDLAILSHSFRSLGMEQPWRFWNDRCVRTVSAIYGFVMPDEMNGTKHNALDDAHTQVAHLLKIRSTVLARRGQQ